MIDCQLVEVLCADLLFLSASEPRAARMRSNKSMVLAEMDVTRLHETSMDP